MSDLSLAMQAIDSAFKECAQHEIFITPGTQSSESTAHSLFQFDCSAIDDDTPSSFLATPSFSLNSAISTPAESVTSSPETLPRPSLPYQLQTNQQYVSWSLDDQANGGVDDSPTATNNVIPSFGDLGLMSDNSDPFNLSMMAMAMNANGSSIPSWISPEATPTSTSFPFQFPVQLMRQQGSNQLPQQSNVVSPTSLAQHMAKMAGGIGSPPSITAAPTPVIPLAIASPIPTQPLHVSLTPQILAMNVPNNCKTSPSSPTAPAFDAQPGSIFSHFPFSSNFVGGVPAWHGHDCGLNDECMLSSAIANGMIPPKRSHTVSPMASFRRNLGGRADIPRPASTMGMKRRSSPYQRPFSPIGRLNQLSISTKRPASPCGSELSSPSTPTANRGKGRTNHAPEVEEVFVHWLLKNYKHPYPDKHEKQMLMELTGAEDSQIMHWFDNARRRAMGREAQARVPPTGKGI
ncbi:hypothetical protein BJ742DRAFT_776576 [Cladochytrium replicatum]|nr:hypothetical protein BJ742DRAFT_776576 [Cladochytrium replicatum]